MPALRSGHCAHRRGDDPHRRGTGRRSGTPVHVVTSLPWYRAHAIESGWDGRCVRTEETAWGSITRVHPFPGRRQVATCSDGRSGSSRYSLLAGVHACAPAGGSVDRGAVIAMSPPLTLGLTGWVASRLRRCPMVFNIQDVFPGRGRRDRCHHEPHGDRRRAAGSNGSAIALPTPSPCSPTTCATTSWPSCRAPSDTVHVIPNFVDTEAIRPCGPFDRVPRRTRTRRRARRAVRRQRRVLAVARPRAVGGPRHCPT